MTTHKIKIRKDINNLYHFTTLDEAQEFIDPKKEYDSISAETEDGHKTLIFIADEWREVANIDFE